MCSHYQTPKNLQSFRTVFAVEPPVEQLRYDMWPAYRGPFVRRPRELETGDEAVPERELVLGRWGLVPHWAEEPDKVRSTFNARSETAATKATFKDAWKRGQRCIIPVEALFEPDWRSGKAIPTRFSHVDGAPLGIAGLWADRRMSDGTTLASYTMLTINADAHPLLRDYHKPDDEKRMVVILPAGAYDDWLNAPVPEMMDFMQPYPAERLVAMPVQP